MSGQLEETANTPGRVNKLLNNLVFSSMVYLKLKSESIGERGVRRSP